jgi:hypothetical protein
MGKVFVPTISTSGRGGSSFTAGRKYPLLAEEEYTSDGELMNVQVNDDNGRYCFIYVPNSTHFGDPRKPCGFVAYDVKDRTSSDYLYEYGRKWREFMEYGVTAGTFVRLLEQHGFDDAIKYAKGQEAQIDEDIFGEPEPKLATYLIAPVPERHGCYPAGTVMKVSSQHGDELFFGEIVYVPGRDPHKFKGFRTNARTDDCAHLDGDHGWIMFEDYPERWED